MLPSISLPRASALAVAQLGSAAFFIAGVTGPALGQQAVWFVLAATVFAAFVRAIDIESWGFFIPGGFVGRLEQAFGQRFGNVGSAAGLVERSSLAALACVVIGRYIASLMPTAVTDGDLARLLAGDFSTTVAVLLIGGLWARTRLGWVVAPQTIARWIWVGVGILGLVVGWGLFTVASPSSSAHVRLARFLARRQAARQSMPCCRIWPASRWPCRRSEAATRWPGMLTSSIRRVSRRCGEWRCSCWCSACSRS